MRSSQKSQHLAGYQPLSCHQSLGFSSKGRPQAHEPPQGASRERLVDLHSLTKRSIIGSAMVMETEDVAIMLIGTVLVCLMLLRFIVLVFFYAQDISRTLRRWIEQVLLPLHPRMQKAASVEQLRLADDILRVRLALSHRALTVYAILVWLSMGGSVINIFFESPRDLSLSLVLGSSWKGALQCGPT